MEFGTALFMSITFLLVLAGLVEKNSKALFLLQVTWMYILLAGNTFSIDITVNQDIFDWAQMEQLTLYDYICYGAGSYLGMEYLTMNAWICLCVFTLFAVLLWQYVTNPCLIMSLIFCYPFVDMVIQKRWFIASAIALVGLLFLLKGNMKGRLVFFLLITLAVGIHVAAIGYLVFLWQPFFHRIHQKWIVLFFLIVSSAALMPYLPTILMQIPFIGEAKVLFYFEVLHEKIKYPILNFFLWAGFHLGWVLLFRHFYVWAKTNMPNRCSRALDILYELNLISLVFIPLYYWEPTFWRTSRNLLLLDYIFVAQMMPVGYVYAKKAFGRYILYTGYAIVSFFLIYFGAGAGYEVIVQPIFTDNILLELLS
ncbi:EpsG family protein [uncultured Selenomonas sp.]|uniref:EpsG family protein n=1 Tax=uncultured Selenomonas sp. TaxID=159275 RepID=UPI00267530BB|nr:EpsG family protein [uncultured Selenomonas sp.]